MVAGANQLDMQLPQRHPRPRLYPDRHRRHPGHQRGRARPHRPPAHAARQSRRDRPHLQARLQVFKSRWGPRCSTATAKKSPRSWAPTGSGVERILTAAIETSAARFWEQTAGESYAPEPAAIAPFQVIVTITNMKEQPLVDAGRKHRRRTLPRRHRRPARRPRRACRGQVQGRRPHWRSISHRRRQKACGGQGGTPGPSAKRNQGCRSLSRSERVRRETERHSKLEALSFRSKSSKLMNLQRLPYARQTQTRPQCPA